MKKVLSLALSLILVMALLAGCGEKVDDDKKEDATPTPSQSTEAPSPTPEDTPTPENTPTPEATPTPEVDPNLFLKADFDSDSQGTMISESDYPDMTAPDTTPLFFSGMGSATGEFAEGAGVDGSNCMLVTGRADTWNGISCTVPAEMFGKGYHFSFDVKFTSEELEKATLSLTTKFNTLDGDSPVAHYPDYNRVANSEVPVNEWVHLEGTVYFPTDTYTNPEDGNYNALFYFELAESKDDFYLDNLEITVVDGIGDFATMEEKKDEISAANKPK